MAKTASRQYATEAGRGLVGGLRPDHGCVIDPMITNALVRDQLLAALGRVEKKQDLPLVCDRYGLGGRPAESDQALGEKNGISAKEVEYRVADVLRELMGYYGKRSETN